jgi:YggT family protein
VSMGPVAIDFGWSLTMLVVIIGLYVTLGFR